MKKKKILRICGCVLMTASVLLSACTGAGNAPKDTSDIPAAGTTTKSDDIKPGEGDVTTVSDIDIDLSGNMFSFTKDGGTQPKKENTVMIYLVGTNLETETQAASRDLIEMHESGVDCDTTNVIVCTGGTRGWWLDISSDVNGIYRFDRNGDDLIYEAETDHLSSMGEAQTLVDFLNFSYTNYPAEHYSLIMWDHGLGPVQGLCYDEMFSDVLEPVELDAALAASPFGSGAHLDFVGFDACLMATFEMASLLSPYADYMIASQEVESAFGWNFSFLKKYNDAPDTITLAQEILTTYEAFFEENRTSYFNPDVTLSVLDLSQTDAVADAMGDLFSAMEKDLTEGAYRTQLQVRDRVKEFSVAASGGRSDAMDLIDLKDLATLLTGDYPAEAKALSDAVDGFVVSQVTNLENTGGVSLYYPCYNQMLFQYYEVVHPFSAMRLPDSYASYMGLFATATFDGEIPGPVEEVDAETAFASFDMGRSDDDGVYLTLTDEQLEATERIFYTIFYEDAPGAYVPVVINARLEADENGEVSVPVTQPVFAVTTDIESGDVWPVIQLEAGTNRNIWQTFNAQMSNTYEFWPYGDSDSYNVTFAERIADGSIMVIDVERNEDNFSEETVAVHNGKETVDVGDWDYITFSQRAYLETYDEDGNILPFFDWERDDWMWMYFFQLDRTFRFESAPISKIPQKKFVQFIVRDTDKNFHASSLLELKDEHLPDVATSGNMTFYVFDDHAELTAYEGEDTVLTIPETVSGQPVTMIGARIFEGNETLEKVTVPDSVETIGSGAFRRCTALADVTLPSSLTELASDAFSGCTALTSITLPDTIETIGVYALGHTGITELTVPASVKDIHAGALADCDNLTTITLEDETHYKVVDGVLYTADLKTLVAYPDGLSDTYVIPEGTEEIGDYAFASNETLRSITYPSTLKEIGEFAFYNTPMLEDGLTFPDSLTRIGAGAFFCVYTDSEAEIDVLHFGAQITEIATNAFDGRHIGKTEVDEDNERYASPEGVLTNKSGDLLLYVPSEITGTFTIPDGVVAVSDDAFPYTRNIDELIIPDSVIYLGGLSLPGSKYTIGAGVMEWKSVTSLNYDEITISEDNAYFSAEDNIIYSKDQTVLYNVPYSNGDEEFTVKEGVTTIADNAIHMRDLRILHLPSTLTNGVVTKYGSNNFFLQRKLEEITVADGNELYQAIDGILYSADGTVVYAIPPQVGDNIVFAEGVTEIAANALDDINHTMEIHIPETVTSLNRITTYITTPYSDDEEMTVDFYIPASVTEIDSRILSSEVRSIASGEESVVTIHAPAGSYAETFFKELGFTVVNN